MQFSCMNHNDIMACFLIWIVLCCVLKLSLTVGKVLKSVDHRQISDTEVLVTWQLVQEETIAWNYKLSYTYRMVQIGDCQPLLRSSEVALEVGPWQNSLTLRGLQSWRSYRYKLKASPPAFTHEHILAGVFSTVPNAVPAKSVQHVQVHNVTLTSVDLSWQEPACADRNGPLRRFDVELTGHDSPVILNAYTGLYVTVSNLRPFTLYTVRVRYVNSVGSSSFTDPLNFTTAAAVRADAVNWEKSTVRSAPTDKRAGKGDESLDSWAEKAPEPLPLLQSSELPQRAVTSSHTRIDRDMGDSGVGESPSTMRQEEKAPPIMSQAAETADGDPKPQRSLRSTCGTVDNPCAPYDLKQGPSTLTCVEISWSVNYINVISAFDVFDCTHDSNVNHALKPKTSPPSSSQSVQLCGLEPGKFYVFGVQSRTANNNVSSIALLRVHTKHLAPPRPPTPRVNEMNHNSLQIILTPVTNEFGPVTSYYIIVESLSMSEQERVDAGMASGPVGYISNKRVIPAKPNPVYSDNSGVVGPAGAARAEGDKENGLGSYDLAQNQKSSSGTHPSSKSQLPSATNQIGNMDPEPFSDAGNGRPQQIPPDQNGGSEYASSQNGRLGQMPFNAGQYGRKGQEPVDISQSGIFQHPPSGSGQTDVLGQQVPVINHNSNQGQVPIINHDRNPGHSRFSKAHGGLETSSTDSDNGFVKGMVDSSLRAPAENRVKNSASHFRGPPDSDVDSQQGNHSKKTDSYSAGQPYPNKGGSQQMKPNRPDGNNDEAIPEQAEGSDQKDSDKQTADGAEDSTVTNQITQSQPTFLHLPNSSSLSELAFVSENKSDGINASSSVPYLIVRQRARRPIYGIEGQLAKKADVQEPEIERPDKHTTTSPLMEVLSGEAKVYDGENGQLLESEAGTVLLQPKLVIENLELQRYGPPILIVKKVKNTEPETVQQITAVKAAEEKSEDRWIGSVITVDSEDSDLEGSDTQSLTVLKGSKTHSTYFEKAVATTPSDITAPIITRKHELNRTEINSRLNNEARRQTFQPKQWGEGDHSMESAGGKEQENAPFADAPGRESSRFSALGVVTEPSIRRSGEDGTWQTDVPKVEAALIINVSLGPKISSVRDVTPSLEVATATGHNADITTTTTDTEPRGKLGPSGDAAGSGASRVMSTRKSAAEEAVTRTNNILDGITETRHLSTDTVELATEPQTADTETQVDHVLKSSVVTGKDGVADTKASDTDLESTGKNEESSPDTANDTLLSAHETELSAGMQPDGEISITAPNSGIQDTRDNLLSDTKGEDDGTSLKQNHMLTAPKKETVHVKDTRSEASSTENMSTLSPAAETVMSTATAMLQSASEDAQSVPHTTFQNQRISAIAHESGGSQGLRISHDAHDSIINPFSGISHITKENTGESPAVQSQNTTDKTPETSGILVAGAVSQRLKISYKVSDTAASATAGTLNTAAGSTAIQMPGNVPFNRRRETRDRSRSAVFVTAPENPIQHTMKISKAPSWKLIATIAITTKNITDAKTDFQLSQFNAAMSEHTTTNSTALTPEDTSNDTTTRTLQTTATSPQAAQHGTRPASAPQENISTSGQPYPTKAWLSSSSSLLQQTDIVRQLQGEERGKRTERTRGKRQSQAQSEAALPPGHIVAELENIGSTRGFEFRIGDGKVYNSFVNSPLDSSAMYRIYLVANSEVESVLFSVSEPLTVRMPLYMLDTRARVHERRDNIIVISVFCAFAFILMVIMIWLKLMEYGADRNTIGCCVCNVPDQFFVMEDDPKMMLLFNRHGPRHQCPAGVDQRLASIMRHWSQTFSLSEPRSILTGRELLPPPQMPLPNPNPDRPVGSEPVTFYKEFQSLPRPNPANSSLAGRRHPELNNNPTVLPFDATRVILDHDGTGAGDYINASYITGYMDNSGSRSNYIAAQCPFDDATAVCLWRMIFQQAVNTVVVLNRTIEDGTLCCLQFWPQVGTQERGPYVIQTQDQFTYAHYTEVLVSVRQKKWREDEHRVRVFCFTSWPETGVLKDPLPLVELCTRVHKSHGSSDRPLLVQCDSGAGRSAVFIAIDILLAQYAAEQQASVFEVVCSMRSERPFMIQTFPQYVLLYEAVLEEMHAGDTWLARHDLRHRFTELNSHNPNTGHTYLLDQFILLDIMLDQNHPTPEEGDPNPQSAYKHGVRDAEVPDVVPTAQRLPPTAFGSRGLHNANYNSNVDHWPEGIGDHFAADDDSMVGMEGGVIFVDGYRRKSQFIMAKTPIPATVVDFWRHVYENDVRTIVAMQDLDQSVALSTGGPVHGEYWPSMGTRTWEPFVVELVDTQFQHNITVRTLRLLHTHRTREEAKVVRQFQFHDWNSNQAAATQTAGRGSREMPLWGYESHQQPEAGCRHPPYPSQGRGRCLGCPAASSRSKLLALHSMVSQWQAEVSVDSTPIIVHCHNGAHCSGVYVAISLLIARIDEENLVSVYRICRALRKLSYRTIPNFEQYKFLYKILWDHVNHASANRDAHDHVFSPLDSPETGAGRQLRGVKEEIWDHSPMQESRRPVYQPVDDYTSPRPRQPADKEQYMSQTVELTETEESQTEEGMSRVSDYHSVSTIHASGPCHHHPQPLYARTTTPPYSQFNVNNDVYRFTPHTLPITHQRLSNRPPRQERDSSEGVGEGGGGGRSCSSPRKTPTTSPKRRSREWSECTSGSIRDAHFTPRGADSPRTSTRNQPHSSLAQSLNKDSLIPSPLPRPRTQSLSPVARGGRAYTPRRDSTPRQRRQKERAEELCSEMLGRRSSTSSLDGGLGTWETGEGMRVRSQIQETTEVEDAEGVLYREQVTDTLQDLSTSTRSESEG